MKRLNAIVQITDKCNLACNYCYVGEFEGKDMSEDTFDIAINKMVNFVGKGGHINLIYHGGEPLVRGLDFLEHASETVNRYNKDVSIDPCLQSNGTLITPEVAKFLREKNIYPGISLDGPKEIHDRNRIYRNGRGSFDKTFEGLTNLAREGFTPSAISVLTKVGLPKIRDIYDFFNSNKINFHINPVDNTGRCECNSESLVITPEEYAKAQIELFDMWFYDADTNIRITDLEDHMKSLIKGDYHGCTFSSGSCGTSYVSLTPDGDVYPCSRFSDDEKFKIGNINTDEIYDMFDKNLMKIFRQRTNLLEDCKPCEYLDVCNGGCTSRAYSQSGEIVSRDYYCESIKMVFGHIKGRLEDVANQNTN